APSPISTLSLHDALPIYFIAVLNRLRENRITREDIAFLNNFYKAPDEIKALKDTITLTTHNYIADGHNRKELDNLKSKSHYFERSEEHTSELQSRENLVC